MYIPGYFAETDRSTQIEFVRQYNFGILVCVLDGEPQVSHIPFLVDDSGQDAGSGPGCGIQLRGHLARANPHWKHLQNNNCLAIFQGPHAYISPTWYQSPGVPTWNYTAVHMKGKATLIDDSSGLHRIVEQLSEQHEGGNPNPWQGNYAPAMLNAIVGFSIDVTSIEAKFKLSQNRPDADKDSVLEALQAPFGETPDDNQKQTRALMQRAFRQ